MATINTIVLKGNVTRDAEVKKVGQSGIALCKLGMAVTNYIKKPGQEKPEEETCFIDIVCWGDLAERVGAFRKGEGIVVHGRLKMESWQDKQTGATRTKHVIAPQTVEAIARLEGQPKPVARQPVARQPVAPYNHFQQNYQQPQPISTTQAPATDRSATGLPFGTDKPKDGSGYGGY